MSSEASQKPPSLLRNPISLLGVAVTIVSTAFGLPMMFVDMLSKRSHPYIGVMVYLVLPFVAMGGVVIILLGLVWERRRRMRRPGMKVPPLPRLDLNKSSHQFAVGGALTLIMIIVVLLSITGYRAYNFTDSIQFCGLVCHKVMQPEYIAYQHSPHARVACVQCHVGPGASWFVRSKITGAYQVYATTFNKYPRPIPTPVKSLRPAQETCEQCHWPAKFFGAQQKMFSHYLSDENNSPWQLQMLIKVGGGDPKTGATAGIHWHMNIKNEIYYIASDEHREVLPWVRVVDPDGNVSEYMSTQEPLTSEQISKGKIRRMDCMDCHNRPSHIYYPPDRAIEKAFEAGRLDKTLPYLKREGIKLLLQPYKTEKEAQFAIPKGLAAFYEKEYQQLYKEKGLAIQRSASELARIFSTNFFPKMKVDWRVYPNHIGHLNSDGCFRCHDGLHKSADGKVITKDCNACHTILAQGPPEAITAIKLQEQAFQHPVDVGMDVTEFKCSQCHTGTGGI